MKKEILISVFLGVLSSSLVAESLKLNPSQFSVLLNPCPDNFTGNVPNPDDCHSFYICHEGRGEVFPCGEFCYNPSNDQCDFCEVVPGCGGTGTRPPTTSTQSPPQTTTTTTTTTTTNAPPTTRPSPDPTTAPPQTTSARPPSTASTTTQRPTTTQGGGGEDLPCPDVPFVYMPYPGDCNRFYYCVEGQSVGVYNCGVNLWFSYNMQACIPPWGDSCN